MMLMMMMICKRMDNGQCMQWTHIQHKKREFTRRRSRLADKVPTDAGEREKRKGRLWGGGGGGGG